MKLSLLPTKIFFSSSKNKGSPFSPNEIIFASTTACNLHCKHCFIDRRAHHLEVSDAVNFLQTCPPTIEKIGFSGGEPFLRSDFLEEIIKSSIEYDFMFDRIMTNGDWWKTEQDLRATLRKIYDAGYDGKIGVSYDTFHAQSEERIVTFIQTAWKIFGGDSVEIQSVLPIGEKLRSLAKRLNLTYEENLSKSGLGIATLTRDEIFLPAYIQTESYQANDSRAFKDKTWFKDDFCESMGQILFVHATGDIAPCCGFANENKALFIGKLTDTFDTVLQKSRENNMVSLCFERGLSSEIKRLQKEGKLPAGKTSDICTFCDFVCNCL